MRRLAYNVLAETGENTGVYTNDLFVAKYFAEKWARESALPHIVIDRECNLIYYANSFGPQTEVPDLA